MSQHTQRTLKYLKDKNYLAGVVERWLGFAGKFGKRQDLFNFCDIVAVHLDFPGTLYVQSTGPSGHTSHLRNLLINPHVETVLSSHTNRVWLISWRKLKKNRNRWTPRIDRIRIASGGGLKAFPMPDD